MEIGVRRRSEQLALYGGDGSESKDAHYLARNVSMMVTWVYHIL